MCGYDPFYWHERELDSEYAERMTESEDNNDNRINENRERHTEFTGNYGEQQA